jgi:hypothetical protein
MIAHLVQEYVPSEGRRSPATGENVPWTALGCRCHAYRKTGLYSFARRQ